MSNFKHILILFFVSLIFTNDAIHRDNSLLFSLKKSMKRNQKIKIEDIIMKRPGVGLNGQKLHLVLGKKLKSNLFKDHQIKLKDLF